MTGRFKIIGVFFEAFFTILLFSSCQKEITNEAVSSGTTPSTTTKVKTYSEYYAAASSSVTLLDSFDLTYDASNRLTSLVSGVNSGNKLIYTYNSNNSYSLDIFEANAVTIHEQFFLNSSPLVDSTVQVNDTGDTTTEKYSYNSNKQLSTLKEYFFDSGVPDINITTYSYDSKGNVTQEISTNPPSTTTYEYYPDLTNGVSIGQTFFYQNKNLAKTVTYTSGGTTISAQHTYTFDSSGRQTSEKIVTDNGSVAIKNYTYY